MGYTTSDTLYDDDLGDMMTTPPGLTALSNITELGSNRSSSYSECTRTFLFVLYVPVLGAICLFGVIGNGLSFLVLWRDRKNQVASFLLRALAVADTIFLLVGACVTMPPRVRHYEKTWVPEWFSSNSSADLHLKVFGWPILHTARFGTVWLSVLIAAVRCVVVHRPLHAAHLCTLRKVRVQVIILVIVSFLYNIPHFFQFRLGDPERITWLKFNYYFKLIYTGIMYCIFVFFLPYLLLTILTVTLVYGLMKAKRGLNLNLNFPRGGGGSGGRKDGSVRSRERDAQNVTCVMLVLLVILLACQTPNLAVRIIEFRRSSKCPAGTFYLAHIANILIYLNSAVNFIVYCMVRKQFRRELADLTLYVSACCSKTTSGRRPQRPGSCNSLQMATKTTRPSHD